MKEKLKKELVDSRDVAYLIDRIRVNKGKKQMYGTQFFVNKNGKFVPRPIYNKKDLNKRRKDVGLGSFASYKGKMRLKNRELDKK